MHFYFTVNIVKGIKLTDPLALEQLLSASGGNQWPFHSLEVMYMCFQDCNKTVLLQLCL